MFSLANYVNEQLNFFGDILDKRPSQVSRSAKDPLLLVVDDKLSLKEKVSKLLKSELASQQIWAITNIANLVSKNIECMNLVKEIPQFFISKSAKVELAAVKTAYALLWHDSKKYTSIFLKPVIDRISAIPAIEYAQCIDIMSAALIEGNIDMSNSTTYLTEFSSFLPLIKKLFEQDESHQHAGSLIIKDITSCQSFQIHVTEEEFHQIFLKSPVFVNEYLSPTIARNFSCQSRFGEEWISTRLPHQLLQLDEKFRLGVAKYFIDFIDHIKAVHLYSSVHDAYQWASNDPIIASAIVERIEIISKSRFVDLVTKTYSLLTVISSCGSSNSSSNFSCNSPGASSTLSSNSANPQLVAIRAKLPKTLIDHPMLYSASEDILKTVLTNLANDSATNVKCAFLDNLSKIYNSADSKTKDTLLTLYQNLFKEKDNKVLEKLVDTSMLVNLANNRPPHTISLFLNIADKFKTRWRFFSKILRSFEQFPSETFTHGIKQLFSIVVEAVKVNPQALMLQANSFFLFCVHSNFQVLKVHDLLNYLAHEFGHSEQYQMRIFYLKIATSLIDGFVHNNSDYYIDNVWSKVVDFYMSETVEFVFIKLIKYLIEFINKFNPFNSVRLTKDIHILIETTSVRFRKKKDSKVQLRTKSNPVGLQNIKPPSNDLSVPYLNPDIDSLMAKLIPLIPSNGKSFSASPSFEKLPTIIDKQSPRLRRPMNNPPGLTRNISNQNISINSSQIPRSSNNLKLPRPVPAYRNPSPKSTARPKSFTTGGKPMTKSNSNASINTMRFPKL
ncbi:hypothetical protein M9Y10_040949 [Tritrichomonas musculus]|uniref:TOG domain-containing protein n=1 Tax=Tritrichomonas musculus TaxID=1915356 RepID=A0ABR2K632_9EUKA